MKLSSIAIVFIFQLFLSASSFAQNTIVGEVRDTTNMPLRSVSVRLVVDKDTISQVTNDLGRYTFHNVTGRTIYLTYSLIGYRTRHQSLFVVKDQSSVEVAKMVLEPMPFFIKDVNIVKVIPIVVKTDTVQFNFDAYRFRTNSLLEEAIKSLPGFTVSRDGAVYYNGQAIKRAQVDHKDFFGGELLTATKNLPTEFIKNLQVIDYYGNVDEATGIKTGDSEKIINITLKPDKKQIYFGQATVGGGTNERYLGSVSLNKFNDGREVSILGSINNTNTNMVYLGGGASGRGHSMMDIGDYSEPVDGVNQISSAAINLTDQVTKSLTLTTSYNFIRQKNVTDGFSELTSTYIGNVIKRKENYVLKTNDFNHNVKFSMKGKFDNQDELKVNGNFTFNTKENYNLKNTDVTNAQIRSKGVFQDTTEFTSPNGELEVFYSKYLSKKGRKLVSQFCLLSNSLERNEIVSETYFEMGINQQQPGQSKFLQDQMIDQTNVTNSGKFGITYVEPFFEHSRFEFNYSFDLTGINTVRSVYDRLHVNEPSFIDSLAVNYNYSFRNNHFGLNYHYDPNSRAKLTMGFAVEPIVLNGKMLLENTSYSYENINLIPTLNFKYNISKDLDWQIDYRGKNNQPLFIQIAPVVDNSNSRNIIIGNPELKAESSHRVLTKIRKVIPSRSQYFETNFVYNLALNKIVTDKTSLSNTTVQQTTFRNSTGYYDVRWFYIFNTPMITDDLQLDISGNTDYFNNPSYIDNRKRITKQLMLNQSLQLKYMWSDYVEAGFVANYNYNKAQYDIPFRTKISVNTMQLGFTTKAYLRHDVSLGVEMSQRFNDGYTSSFMNINQTIVNSFIEYSFLPNKSALLRLQGFDLLDQNKSMGIYSEYIGNDVYEARNNRLGQYFMLSLNLRMQKYPKK